MKIFREEKSTQLKIKCNLCQFYCNLQCKCIVYEVFSLVSGLMYINSKLIFQSTWNPRSARAIIYLLHSRVKFIIKPIWHLSVSSTTLIICCENYNIYNWNSCWKFSWKNPCLFYSKMCECVPIEFSATEKGYYMINDKQYIYVHHKHPFNTK